MYLSAIDSKIFKISFGVFVGAPATLVFLFFSIYAYVFFFGLVDEFDPVYATLVGSYFLGALGFIGAWIRLINRKESLSSSTTKWIKGLLTCGIFSSIILIGLVISFSGFIFLAVLVPMLLIGVSFYAAT